MITQDDIIYFIVTDRFNDGDTTNNGNVDKTNIHFLHGGDLKGIEDKFDYLLHLGITTIWITPVYVNIHGPSGKEGYHYYWPKDFEKIDDHLYTDNNNYPVGDRRYLKDFVSHCHHKGIKVILDVVVNHVGQGVDETNSVIQNEWVSGNFSGLPLINLNNPDALDYFINNLMDWIEMTGIDGLRMDMAKDIPAKFWYYYKSLIKGRFPDLFIVGEVLDYNSVTNAVFQNQYDLNSIFDFPLTQVLKDTFINNGPLVLLARPRLNDNEERGILDKDDISKDGYYTNANRLVTLLDNHDLDRRILSEIRNKYTGDANKGLSYKIAELLYAFIFTIRGIPQIYYGSETGLEGWKNDNGKDDADLRRDFPWAMIDENNNVTAINNFEASLFNKIKSLVAFRKSSAAVKYGVTITLWADQFVYAFLRYCKDEVVICVFNNGFDSMPLPMAIPIKKTEPKIQQLLPGRIIDLLESKGLFNVFNPAETFQIVNSTLSVIVDGKSCIILSVS